MEPMKNHIKFFIVSLAVVSLCLTFVVSLRAEEKVSAQNILGTWKHVSISKTPAGTGELLMKVGL